MPPQDNNQVNQPLIISTQPVTQNLTKDSNLFSKNWKKLLAILTIIIVIGIGLYLWLNRTIGLYGIVVDISGTPIKNVQIQINGVVKTETNYLGSYKTKIRVNSNDIITFRESGYVPIHKNINVKTNTYNLDAYMFRESAFQEVDTSKKIDVSMSGASLSVDEGSFIVKGTNNGTKTAKISLTSFDPANSEQVKAFPGKFEGIKSDGKTENIESFGFTKVQVRDKDDKPLDLAKGKTATVVIPISQSSKDTSPDTIPLWNYDEKIGAWVDKGTAHKFCDQDKCYYKGQITTIASWWNCDAGIENSGQINAKFGFFGDVWGTIKGLFNAYIGVFKDFYNGAVGATNAVTRWLWSKTGELFYNVFMPSNQQNNIENARNTAWDNKVKEFPELEGKSWSDLQNMAADKGYTYNLSALLSGNLSSSNIVHQSTFDVPGSAAYSLESKADSIAGEAKTRANGWYNKDSNPENAVKEFSTAAQLANSTLTSVFNKTGDTSVYDLMKYSESLKGNSSISDSEKRADIYNEMRNTFADDQTLQGSHSIADVVEAKAGVCRDLSSILFNAYNSAGIPTTINSNSSHEWVESTNSDGSVVSVDPNGYRNYVEFSGSRGGNSMSYNGDYKLLNGATGNFFDSGARAPDNDYAPLNFNNIFVSTVYASEENFASVSTSSIYCSIIGYCVDKTKGKIINNLPDRFDFISNDSSFEMSVFNDSKFLIDNLGKSKGEFTLKIKNSDVTGKIFDLLIPGKNIFVAKIDNAENKNQFIVISSTESFKQDPTTIKSESDITNTREVVMPANAQVELKLEGIDYNSSKSVDASFDQNGGLVISGGDNLFGKPNGKAKLTLSAKNLYSEPKIITVPAVGKTLDLNIEYSGILIPIVLNDMNNAANILINIDSSDGVNTKVRRLFSKDESRAMIFVLVNPGVSHEVKITDVWTNSTSTVKVDSMLANKVTRLDVFNVIGKKFEDISLAEATFECEQITDTDSKNYCYTKFIVKQAKAKKDPIMCFNVADYPTASSPSYISDCIEAIDSSKSLSFELLKPELEKSRVTKLGLFDSSLISPLSEYYNDNKYCGLMNREEDKNYCNIKIK